MNQTCGACGRSCPCAVSTAAAPQVLNVVTLLPSAAAPAAPLVVTWRWDNGVGAGQHPLSLTLGHQS